MIPDKWLFRANQPDEKIEMPLAREGLQDCSRRQTLTGGRTLDKIIQ